MGVVLCGVELPCAAVESLGTMSRMSRRDLILGEHREAILAAAAANKATEISLVGSVARGDDVADSDVDFLATFPPTATLFDLGGLQIDLEDLLGVGVDIIDAAGLEAKHAAILHDAIPL